MSKVRVDLQELKQAIAEIEARTNDTRVTIESLDHKVQISASDRNDNMVDVVLYEDGALGASFRCTERLMYMKKKSNP